MLQARLDDIRLGCDYRISAGNIIAVRPCAVAKSVLLVGLDPSLIDFSRGGYPDGMNAQKVFAGVNSTVKQLSALGYNVETCSIDSGDTAEQVLRTKLAQGDWDCIMIGAGIRVNPDNLLLFESIVNAVHQCAPDSKICFNEVPSDTVNAVMRWIWSWST